MINHKMSFKVCEIYTHDTCSYLEKGQSLSTDCSTVSIQILGFSLLKLLAHLQAPFPEKKDYIKLKDTVRKDIHIKYVNIHINT